MTNERKTNGGGDKWSKTYRILVPLLRTEGSERILWYVAALVGIYARVEVVAVDVLEMPYQTPLEAATSRSSSPPPSEVMRPPLNRPSTFRLFRGWNASFFSVHCVGMGRVFGLVSRDCFLILYNKPARPLPVFGEICGLKDLAMKVEQLEEKNVGVEGCESSLHMG
jgi:hypothetical protein